MTAEYGAYTADQETIRRYYARSVRTRSHFGACIIHHLAKGRIAIAVMVGRGSSARRLGMYTLADEAQYRAEHGMASGPMRFFG